MMVNMRIMATGADADAWRNVYTEMQVEMWQDGDILITRRRLMVNGVVAWTEQRTERVQHLLDQAITAYAPVISIPR